MLAAAPLLMGMADTPDEEEATFNITGDRFDDNFEWLERRATEISTEKARAKRKLSPKVKKRRAKNKAARKARKRQ